MVERWLLAVMLAAILPHAHAVSAPGAAATPTQIQAPQAAGEPLASQFAPRAPRPQAEADQRIASLSEQLRCLVCQNQSLAESDAALAADLRTQVRTLVLAGRTDRQVVDHLVERYGDFIRYDPPFKPSTWLLWLIPAALPLAGLGLALRWLRGRPPGGAQ